MLIKIQQRAVIRWNEQQQCFEVHVGLIIGCKGTLSECEHWCRYNGMPIRNKTEVRMWKAKTLRNWEGIA